MNFSKLPKEKRNHLIGVVFATVLILGALGFYLIKGGYDNLQNLEIKKKSTATKLKEMQDTVKRLSQIEANYTELSKKLESKESGMASGDLYSWMHSTLRRFQKSYKVEIPQINPPSAPSDVNLLPKFQYKQSSVAINGTGYYHDIGRFISDLENNFPLIRIVNLSLEPNPSPGAGEREKLAFKMDLITLVRPSR